MVAVSEEEKLLELYLEGESPNTRRPFSEHTKKSYRRFYKLLVKGNGKDRAGLSGKSITGSTEKEIIDCANEEISTNSKQGILNIGLVIRQAFNKSIAELESARKSNKDTIVKEVKSKNEVLSEGLPTYADLETFIDYLYLNAKTENMWKEYIINYLLFTYQTRNSDLNFKLVDKKGEVGENGNYMWLSQSQKKATWYRRDYKTAGKYGSKEIIITNEDFIRALSKISKGDLFENPNQIGYYIQKSTLGGIGEGNYMKIIVNHFRGSRTKLEEIADSRGTDLKTILSNYDIEFK